ncbi:MAG: hypothetical protein U0835_20910 [Isosphaeraceae bacterium]
MIEALAPEKRRGCRWVQVLLLSAGLGSPAAVIAQDTRPAPAAPKGAPTAKGAPAPASKDQAKDAPAAKEAEPEPEPEAEAPANQLGRPGSVEVFKDELAEKALEVFKSVPGLRDCNPTVINQVKAMAANAATTDREVIQRFVQGMAYRLIDKGNINGLIAPPPEQKATSFAARAIKDASDNLIDPINSARLAKNDSFLREYNRALIDTLPKLLDNNLVSRVEAVIVLGQTGDPAIVPIMLAQLKNKEQTVWVKLWAARGLYNVVDGGQKVDTVLSVKNASDAGKALADFLSEELPWPAQVRGLEALGAMRQAALPTAPQKVDMATAAIKLLSDPSLRPEVRSAAAWALGMVRVNPNAAKYNFPLVAYLSGSLSADLADLSLSRISENKTFSEYMAGLLLGPVFQSFNGVDGVRESGLLKVPASHPNYGPNAQYIRQIAELQAAVARAAVEVVRVAPGAQARAEKDLGDRVAALKAFLEKNPPKDFHLIPDGEEYRPAPAEKVAEESPAPAPAPAVAKGAARPTTGGPGGR